MATLASIYPSYTWWKEDSVLPESYAEQTIYLEHMLGINLEVLGETDAEVEIPSLLSRFTDMLCQEYYATDDESMREHICEVGSQVLLYWQTCTAPMLLDENESIQDPETFGSLLKSVKSALTLACFYLSGYGTPEWSARRIPLPKDFFEVPLFVSVLAQMPLLMKNLKTMKANPALFQSKDQMKEFWNLVENCKIYLKNTMDCTHNALKPQVCFASNASPGAALAWRHFLHKGAPIFPRVDILRLNPSIRTRYVQVVPPGGQKILEQWDYDYQQQLAYIDRSQPWEWHAGYTGLARSKVEQTWVDTARYCILTKPSQLPLPEPFVGSVKKRLLAGIPEILPLEAITASLDHLNDGPRHPLASFIVRDFLVVKELTSTEDGERLVALAELYRNQRDSSRH